MNNNTIKAMYIQFCGRVVATPTGDKHIVAAALYADKELTAIRGIEVCEMTNFEENKKDKFDVYRNRLGEYATALKLAYKYQNSLIANGYDCIVMCPSNGKLWSWLQGGRIPAQIKDLYNNINKQFRHGGQFKLDISVGLADSISEKKAYKFCKPEYVDAKLCKLRRGVHIMTAEEIKKEEARIEAERKKKEETVLNQEGVSVYDILQPNQGNDFEPVIIFESQSED